MFTDKLNVDGDMDYSIKIDYGDDDDEQNNSMGNVYSWLNDSRYSDDGVTLKYIPFSETRNYVVKVNSSWEHYKEMYQ